LPRHTIVGRPPRVTGVHGIGSLAISGRVPLSSEFVFALCQRGAEVALKREAAQVAPGLAPAYQRPGLVTFRAPFSVTPDFELSLVFARSSGMSLGAVRDLPAAIDRIGALPARPFCLQVVERDVYRAGQEPLGFVRGELPSALDAALRRALPGAFTPSREARPGELVLSAIVAKDDPWVLGIHRHHKGRSPHPGGSYPLSVPSDTPSRAFAKIEEAIAAFDLPVRAGDTALELGAAPGGAAYALLRRGVSVVAVDPSSMDPRLFDYPAPRGARLTYLDLTVAQLRRELLPPRIEWLLLDVHLAPQVALRAARKVASWLRDGLLGAVLTLKLNDWVFADRLESFLAQAREMGLREPRAKQLVSHRQELCIAGLTARGQRR
jgi:23S rRNA (cytidine2498-2'-O)-methyltransferase